MKLLIITLSGIGDTLLTTPAIRILKNQIPYAQIWALVMFKGCQEVLSKNPDIDRIIFWEFLKEGAYASLKFLLNLRKEKFDVSILAYPANRTEYNVVQLLIGAKLRIAHRYKHYEPQNLYFLNNRTIIEEDELHNVEENARLLDFLEIRTTEIPETSLYLGDEEKKFSKDFLKGIGYKKLIGIHAWSTELKNMHLKCWESAKFANLIDILKGKYEYEVLLFEGPHDKKANDIILANTRYKPIVVSGSNILETAALIKQCKVLITNDSGVMHVGAAVGSPIVAIFGPTNPKWTGPWKSKCIIVRKEIDCSPCWFLSPKPLTCKFSHFTCLKSIKVEEVLGAVSKFLDTPMNGQ